jgi:ferredoxin
MRCVAVCPSGALREVSAEETRMGSAVVDRETCVAWTGTLLCRTCYNVCPFPDEAIDLPMLRPEVLEDGCTGCGICVHACPVSAEGGRKAINVEPGGVRG